MRGTGYAIVEIVWWLLVAAAIGFAIGWTLRQWFLSGKHEDEFATFRAEEEQRRAEMASEIENWERKATGLSADLDANRASLERVQTRLAGHESATTALESELRQARSNAIRLEAKVGDRESTISVLRSDLDKFQRAAAASHTDVEEQPDAPQPEPEVTDKVTAIAKVAEIAARTRGAEAAVDDDLERIHGVGPKLERLLKSMDITSFRQVANFTSEDIQYVTAALEAFPGRIERDDWMSSAAEEHSKKYGTSA